MPVLKEHTPHCRHTEATFVRTKQKYAIQPSAATPNAAATLPQHTSDTGSRRSHAMSRWRHCHHRYCRPLSHAGAADVTRAPSLESLKSHGTYATASLYRTPTHNRNTKYTSPPRIRQHERRVTPRHAIEIEREAPRQFTSGLAPLPLKVSC